MAQSTARAPAHYYRRGAVYHYKRRVPEDLRGRQPFPDKEHFQRTLGTSSPPEARRKALELSDWFDSMVAQLRAPSSSMPVPQSSTPPVQLGEAELDAIQAEWWNQGTKSDLRERLQSVTNPELEEALYEQDHIAQLDVADLNAGGPDWRQRYLRDHVYPIIDPSALEHCRQRGISAGSAEYFAIRQALADAELAVLRTRVARSESSPLATFETPAITRGRLGTVDRPPEAYWDLNQLAAHCLSVRKSEPSWRQKVEAVVGLFNQHLVSRKNISQITRSDVQRFLEVLGTTPARAEQRFPGASLSQAVTLNRQRPSGPYPTISPSTIRDTHLAVLRWLLRYAHKNMGAIPTNPVDELKVDGTKRKGGTRTGFQEEELERFFSLPMFTGCRDEQNPGIAGTLKLEDHRFWTPLLMLFTGARPSELAQLATSDIKLDGAYSHISILTEFDPTDPADRKSRPFVVSFKTENARRVIPIHSELIALGFVAFVRRQEASNASRLFPDWKLSSDDRKLYSQASWVRRVNERYIPGITSRKPRPTLYSLRHTFKTRMVACGVSPQAQNLLMGHALGGMDMHYLADGLGLRELTAEVAKVSYPGLKLEPLKRS